MLYRVCRHVGKVLHGTVKLVASKDYAQISRCGRLKKCVAPDLFLHMRHRCHVQKLDCIAVWGMDAGWSSIIINP